MVSLTEVPVSPARRKSPREPVRAWMVVPAANTVASARGDPVLASTTLPDTVPAAWARTVWGDPSAKAASRIPEKRMARVLNGVMPTPKWFGGLPVENCRNVVVNTVYRIVATT